LSAMREAALARELYEHGASDLRYLYMGELYFRLQSLSITDRRTTLSRLLHPLVPENALQGRIRAIIPPRPSTYLPPGVARLVLEFTVPPTSDRKNTIGIHSSLARK
jgi:hypothetical protein